MKITTLVENTCYEKARGIEAEHGISLYIQHDGINILFDCGKTERFLHNAQALGIDLRNVDMVFLSHAHSDHGGGLPAFFRENRKAKAYLHKDASQEYFARSGEHFRSIGLDKEIFQQYAGRLHLVDTFTQVTQGIYILTSIAQKQPVPSGNSLLFRKVEGQIVPDTFSHELILVIEESGGLVVFTGCSHNGILNMVQAVVDRFPGKPIKAVLGGFHFWNPLTKAMSESREEVERVAGELLRFPIEHLYTGHCTGSEAYEIMKPILKEKLGSFSSGLVLQIH